MSKNYLNPLINILIKADEMLQNDISSFKDIQSKNSTYSHLLAENDLLLKGFKFFKQALALCFLGSSIYLSIGCCHAVIKE